jgi:predicted flap endonuclease-1-like 5' DNA nuclease
MSGAAVFAATFLVHLTITLGFSDLPPGAMIRDFLGIPEVTFSIWRISGAALVNGIINGLLWGTLVLAICSLGRHASKRKPLVPLPAPAYKPLSPPEPTPRRVERLRFKVVERKTYVPLDQNIEAIEGIGSTYGSRLRNSGVDTVEDLLRVGANGSGRRYLANEVGVAPATMLKWVYRADLFRIRGIGKQYSALLESAGVNTVTELSMRNPEVLCDMLRKINREKRLVRRTPPYGMVKGWINNAKNLKRIVVY